MCGIAGACWTESDKEITLSTLQQMTDAIRHRGPDAEGHYFDQQSYSSVALGHRRLSIIDLTTGKQPMQTADGKLVITFNGEIYNYKELRQQLIAKGYQFQTESDTEVILYLYQEYGKDCLRYLRGMFAFALWDKPLQRLFFARDRLGKKPFLYTKEQGRFAFASELKSLLTLEDLPRQVSREAIDLFLTYQYVPHPYTIFKDVAKLPPAHYGIYEKGTLQISPYWDAPYKLDIKNDSLENSYEGSDKWSLDVWKQKLESHVTDAIRLRMRSDVPLGSFLSGGIDSTIISGVMQKLSDKPIHTFSIGFNEKNFDERPYARAAAKHIGTDHHEFVVKPDTLDFLDDLVHSYDEPFGDASAIPTMYLSKVTKQLVTVALSGDGGDELFMGYDRYKGVNFASYFDALPTPIKSFLTWKLWQKLPASVEQRSFSRRLKRFQQALADSPQMRYLNWVTIFSPERRNAIYTEEMKKQLSENDSADLVIDAYKRCTDRDFVTQTTCVDVHTYLPCDILNKVDIASMSVGLECRCPFLDQQVAELAARMPMKFKYHKRQTKWILKETFKEHIPDELFNRSKMGFGVPLDHWFRDQLTGLLTETLLSEKAISRGYFNRQGIEKLIAEHQQKVFDHSARLWSLLMLELWMRKFIDN